MASTFSDLLRLTKQTTGENDGTWGDLVNTALELLEDSISGVANISMALSDYTLTTANGASDDARCMVLQLGGTPGASRNIIVPNTSKVYVVRNSTGFAQTVKTASGLGVSVPNGEVRIVLVVPGVGCFQPSTPSSFSTGMILAWYGTPANVPTGWGICDGTNGTPDLRGRFVIGVTADGTTIPLGGTGGSSTASPTTGTAGAHTHGGNTGAHALTVAQMPAHSHRAYMNDTSASGSGKNLWGLDSSPSYKDTSLVSGGNTLIESTGGGEAHQHTIGSDGAHTHTLTPFSTLPPYFGLYWIMKL